MSRRAVVVAVMKTKKVKERERSRVDDRTLQSEITTPLVVEFAVVAKEKEARISLGFGGVVKVTSKKRGARTERRRGGVQTVPRGVWRLEKKKSSQ